MNQLPVMINLTGKSVTVVGAGKVAARHLPKLLAAGVTEVVIYSPRLDPDLTGYLEHSEVTWIERTVSAEESFSTDLLLLTSDDHSLHQALYRNRRQSQWVYVATDPALSDFTFPLTVKKGKLLITLSTSGISPTYAKQIKQKLVAALPEDSEQDLAFLEAVRERVLSSRLPASVRKRLLQQAASEEFLRQPERERSFTLLLEEAIRNN
ncbi:bifunctional precorrin-2 dehydrogenase/sirohydrochlorin ferrochelatase [Alkalihalobacillus oceani]|uniref:precorrin-2 dehydrogenase/sirohydrochlorin ferrochelatase family protein n=1 Tax=Halalkalibacter oceani TaxID=1653776 RepID=UPI00203C8AB1|nr:bifunctional precorrin-2 dehydrogenase/sirohydrochlorin ferrochelatase [Halalkalibacter oceani]MCM3760405.1 bifunctional precorrin-2 dehydrogenase/sirohydrochlorin ferrochelatase [Halalkalibacter oceani]